MPTITTMPASTDALLDEFIFHPDQFRMEDIPRNLPPREVAEFVRRRIDRATPLKALVQTEKVCGYYDLYEACEHFKPILDRREVVEDEIARSIVLTRIMARVGNPGDRDFAKDSYLYLIGRSETTALLEMLIGVYEALGGEADVKPLADKLEKRRQKLEPHKADPSQLKHEYRKVEELLNMALPRATGASNIKQRVGGLRGRRARIDDEIRIYLGQQHGFREYLPEWAARRLRREVWAEQPDQQTVRMDDSGRRAELVDAFRRALAAVDQVPKLSDAEKDFMRVSCIHAIEFFGGTPTPEEQVLLDAKGATQIDVLAVR